MKKLVPLLLCLASLSIHGQEIKAEFDGHKWEAPYHLPIPKDWTIERFLIPISFAPQITYKGVEDIRFTPGWGKVQSEEYWTYAFLWYLDGSHKTTAKKIATNLKAYYTGLIGVNTDKTKLPPSKLIPVTTSFKKERAGKDDLATYTGTIEMIDFMQREPILLYCIVHLRSCTEENKTIFFYELSPKPFTHNNWIALNQLWLDFKCKKNDALK
ncbi:MAG: hypothetical protein H7Y01_14500 [Ferruginibacter sp.]|nr:hypothetical protein [Chitinophagaceae bacterium]